MGVDIMTAWRGTTADAIYSVEIHRAVLDALDQCCRDAGSVETGGVLIGRYSDDSSIALVTEATAQPDDSEQGRFFFVRGKRGLRSLFDQRWKAQPRTFYVGEWHYHPANHVEPSDQDFDQMASIGHARNYHCKEPLLLILGASGHDGDRSLRAWVCPSRGAPSELLRTA